MKTLKILTIVFVAVAALGLSCFFIVTDYQGAVVTQFGRPIKEINEGGLHSKLPWPIQSVHIVDKRMNLLDTRIDEALTRDRRNVVIPVFAIWHVSDAKKFFEALGSIEEASKKLESVVINAKNALLATKDFSDLVTQSERGTSLAQIEADILKKVKLDSEDLLGITVLDVGLRQITLPSSNTEAVFERMRAERARVASQFRADGQRRATEIRAQAEALRIEILARAEGEAAAIRGEGDAAAVRILRDAYEKDPALFEFVRELEVLENVVSPETIIVLGTDSPPFRMITQDPEAR